MKIVFTLHALDRMNKRKISKEEVIDIVRFPEEILKKKGKYYAKKNIIRANVEVIYEKENYIKIITIYYL